MADKSLIAEAVAAFKPPPKEKLPAVLAELRAAGPPKKEKSQ